MVDHRQTRFILAHIDLQLFLVDRGGSLLLRKDGSGLYRWPFVEECSLYSFVSMMTLHASSGFGWRGFSVFFFFLAVGCCSFLRGKLQVYLEKGVFLFCSFVHLWCCWLLVEVYSCTLNVVNVVILLMLA